eukprot:3176164-Pyramimonas_sp.AAC.1
MLRTAHTRREELTLITKLRCGEKNRQVPGPWLCRASSRLQISITQAEKLTGIAPCVIVTMK